MINNFQFMIKDLTFLILFCTNPTILPNLSNEILIKVERSVEDDFPEEYDPYIPISDFPLDRKRREIKDLLGYPVQVERDSEVYDPYRPNEPTIFGKLMFHKIKKVPYCYNNF